MSGQPQGGLGGLGQQRPAGQNPALNQSLNNNFYASNVAASQFNGSGAQVQADKLNLSRNTPAVTVKPGQVQYVEQPVEQVQVVKREQVRGGGRVLNSLDPRLQALIAESQAKIALLLMENNRIKYNIQQKDAEIARLRTTGQQVIVTQPTTTTVLRPSNTVVTSHVVRPTTTVVQPSTTVYQQGTSVVRPTTSTTTVVQGNPATSTIVQGSGSTIVRPATSTVTTTNPTTTTTVVNNNTTVRRN